MMIPSSEYLETLEQTGVSPKSKIIVDGVEYLGDVIKNAPKIKHSSVKFIGTFPIKTVEFSIYDLNNEIDFENKEIEVYKGIVVNNSIEYVKQGIFIPRAENIKTNISDRTVSFSDVQDRTQLLEGAYTSSLDWSNNQTHTGLEIIQEICTRKNIILKNTDFAFASYNFKQPNFSETITDRGVIAAMAEIGGEITIFDSNGKLEIKSKYNTNHTIQRKKYEKLSYEKIIAINTVVLGKEGINDDIVYPETIETERVEAKILDNPFVDLYREEMIEEVANHLIGMSYIPFQIDNFVDGYMYELNDSMTVTDKNGNVFEATILSIESSTRIKSIFSAPKLENAKTDYTLAGSNKESISRVKLDVDHINKRVEVLAEDINESKESITKIEQDSEIIKSSVTKAEKDIKDLSDSLEMFSVDLSQYNLVIPTDSNNKPYSNTSYTIDYYGYFKGKQIIPNVTINNSQGGVTVSEINGKLNFEVKNSTNIENKNFVYEILFEYISEGVTYSLTKKISLTLALRGNDGIQGETGPQGNDGISTYFHVKYSKNANGNPMTNSPDSDTEFMGVASTTSSTPPTSYSAYTWSKIKGDNGSQGVQGADGTSSYFHIKWSKNGKHFSTPNSYASENSNDWEIGQWGMDGNKQEYPQRIRLKELIEVPSNSVLILNTFNSNYLFVIRTYDSDRNYLNSLGAINNENTITLSDVAYLGVTIMKNNGESENEGENILNDLINQDLTPLICLQENYSLGTTPSKWQGTYVDSNPTDSDNFDDYTWNDTSIYVKDDLMNLQENINQANTNINNVSTDLKNNYLTGEEVNALQKHNEESLKQLKEEFSSLQLASNEVLIEIGSILSDGVNKIKTATGYTFDENGLDISKDGEEMHNSMNNEGMYVKRDDEEVLGADASGVRAENITVRNYLMIGKNSRFEDYKSNRTGCFFVGGGN